MTRRSPLVVLALALAPALARAAGTVTGISASPSPATAGSEVSVTVTATGPCQVWVDFGDKTKAGQLSSFPGTLKHTYASAGKFVLRTFSYTSGNEPPGLSRCGGFADMELVVNPKPATRILAPNLGPSGGGSGAERAVIPAGPYGPSGRMADTPTPVTFQAPMAVAPPKITGASATAPFVGLAVTLTITSTRACQDAFVDWGDGSIAEGHALTGSSTTLPAHAYASPGEKKIRVGGRDAPFWQSAPARPAKANACTGSAPEVHVTLRPGAAAPAPKK